MQMSLWICPKCRAIKFGRPGAICSNCGSHVIDTGITMEEYMSWSVEEEKAHKTELIQKYVSSYDPASELNRIEKEEKDKEKTQFAPKCPTCGSFSVRKLSDTENGLQMNWTFPGSANMAGKTFICKNCGYTW